MANKVVLNRTNIELLVAIIQKKLQVQYTKIQYNGQDAGVLSLEDVEKRKHIAENRKKI